AGGLAGPAAASAAALLPDLDQEVPSQLDVAVTGSGAHRSYRLGFGSGVRNVGAGPLVIEGRRAAGTARMDARQWIDGAAGPVEGVGALRYVRSSDHQHWHLLGFERYELRRAGGGGPVLVRDRKSGFCLGDRYRVTTRPVPGAAAHATYTSRCGLRLPGLRRVVEGISVGYGDFYAAHLEYQDLPLAGLRDGRYELVHRVNVGRALRESDYDNDAASVLLDLRWRDGVPHIAVVASCPDSARCAPPVAAGARAVVVLGVAPARRSLLCPLSGGGAGWRP
ncbi:MAG TPA: lysyl oxidase family protein, partial [Baekduia sp.]|nr:lysyl oxidase family protein [Baekduia sp.]